MTPEPDPEDADDKIDASLEVEDLKKHVGMRCCVFLLTAPGEPDRVLHGRMMAVAQQITMIVMRDMTPGLEKLQRKFCVPYDNIRYICQSPHSEKCRVCPEYRRMEIRPCAQ